MSKKERPPQGDLDSEEFGTCARYNSNKTRYDLVPTHLLKSTADVFEYGAGKYAPWNWAKGGPMSQYIGCVKRHLASIEMGDDMDPESKARHIGHAICNLMMMEQLLNLIELNPELAHLDDRPKKWFEGQKY